MKLSAPPTILGNVAQKKMQGMDAFVPQVLLLSRQNASFLDIGKTNVNHISC